MVYAFSRAFYVLKIFFCSTFCDNIFSSFVIEYLYVDKRIVEEILIMRTLYIDVYFLINFTTDILSLYFASRFSKVPTNTRRLIVSALIGALIAVITVFLPEFPILKFCVATVGLLLMAVAAPVDVSFRRRIKFAFAFVIFEALVGGAVSFLWEIMDKYISPLFGGTGSGTINHKMLIMSIIILLSMGVFKMIVSFFSNNQNEKSVDLEISFMDKLTVVSAFVDSGNLAVDPMDMSPIVLIKRDLAKQILPQNIIELKDVDSLDRSIKKRIRLIPISRGAETHVLVGVKVDSVKIINKSKKEDVFVTIAIDREGGTFGGFEALMPAAAIDNAIF